MKIKNIKTYNIKEKCIKKKKNGIVLHVVTSYKYLGHYITDDLLDDDDISRQRRTLFVQWHNIILLRKFHVFLGCETHTLAYILFTYVYSTTLVELQNIYHY